MTTPAQPTSDVIYKLEDKPPLWEAMFTALQHLLAIFMGIITPPLIISQALGFDVAVTSYLVSMALFASGLATFIQVSRFGPLGSGMLCILGTSFNFLAPIIAAGKSGGLPLIMGLGFAGSFVAMFLSRFLSFTKKIFTPLVSGVVVTMIGISLIKVAVIACAGGFGAKEAGDFASLKYLGLSGFVIFLVTVLNRSRIKFVRIGSIVIGLVAGTVAAHFMGLVNFESLKDLPLVTWPQPLKFGMSFSWSHFATFILVYMVTTIEAIGDLTATSMVSREPIEGETYIRRIKGGVMGDGFGSMLATLFNSFPLSTFAQNNGIIQLTGVASRHIGKFIALFLMILGLFPFVGGLVTLIPTPVLGGATLIMFGTVAAAGIKIIANQPINRHAMMTMAISFGLAVGVESVPEILTNFPEIIKNTLGSGITMAGVAAIMCQVFLPKDEVTAESAKS